MNIHRSTQARPVPTAQDSEHPTLDSESEHLLLTSGNQNQRPTVTSSTANSNFLRTLVGLSAISGFLFGYDTGIVSGALVLVKDDFKLTSFQQELVVSATIFTAIVGAAAAVPLNKYYGRKPAILLASLTFLLGSLVLSAASSLVALIGGRLVVGIGIGIGSMVVPMYISEIAPPDQRGTLVTINNVFCPGGQFVAACVSAGLAKTPQGWRWMFGVGAVPALVQLIGFVFMPESPRWLLKSGKRTQALSALRTIRGVADVADVALEFAEFEEAAAAEENQSKENQSQQNKWYSILLLPHVRNALILGCSIQFLQQVSGINTVMYYGASIVQMSGFHQASTAIYANVGLAATNFLGGFLGIYLVERRGRRTLTLVSLGGVVVALACLGTSFYVNDALSLPAVASLNASHEFDCNKSQRCFECVTRPQCGFCTSLDGKDGTCVLTSVGNRTCGPLLFNPWSCEAQNYPAWLSVALLVLYLAFFAPGMGPMPWTINSEIYPLEARSLCVGIATSVNWISNLIVSLTFLSLIDALTAQGAFWLYAGVAGVGFLWLYIALPETKGLSLNEVVDLFRRAK